jgi:outer membrane protein insertion porin family
MAPTIRFCALALIAILLTTTAYAQAQRVSSITIDGNQRIEKETILSYLGISEGSFVDEYELDRALKKLFKTDFFADVSISNKSGAITVKLVENPSINQIVFEGNERISDDTLSTEISLRARSIYTRTKIQNDVKRVLDLYRRGGRYSAEVEPKVVPLDQNRIDLVFEINEGPVTRVQKIIFLGNKAFDDGDLEDVVRTKEYSFYNFLSSNDTYDPDRLLFDQELLRRFYYSEGYADFQVKNALAELTPDNDGFIVTFIVEEGTQYTIGDVSIKSNLKGVNTPDFKALLTTETGDTYDANEVDKSIDAIADELGNEGFAFVDVNPVLDRKPEAQTLDLTYQITEGPRVYVERINIHGNSRTLDNVIRREFRLTEGDPFSTNKIRRSEQRINNLNYFENVNVQKGQGSAPDKTIIDVEVAEKSTGEISLGAGFSTTDGALANFGIKESNFLGRGQELRFNTVIATERQQFDIGFTEPYFLNRELSVGVDLFKITRDFSSESSFDSDTVGGRLRASYPLTENISHSVRYSFQTVDITDVQDDASRFIKDQEGENTTSMIGHSITYDTRDNRLEPNSGSYLRFNQDFAGIGGDARFARHELLAGYYYPIAKNWVFQLYGSTGHMIGLGEDIRINDRFFIGGKQIRGFEDAGVSARDSGTEDALGNNIYYATSAELRFPLGLPEELGLLGSVFIDAGSAWDVDDSGIKVQDSSGIRVSGGFGLSWKSPFGPIRVDIAQPFIKEDFDLKETFRLNFGTRF